jgi:hypothetical protein
MDLFSVQIRQVDVVLMCINDLIGNEILFFKDDIYQRQQTIAKTLKTSCRLGHVGKEIRERDTQQGRTANCTK